jgi:DNA-binding GntR family transcriptional regulator
MYHRRGAAVVVPEALVGRAARPQLDDDQRADVEQATERLRRGIIDGSFAPGEPLVLGSLREELRLPPDVLDQSFDQLRDEGFVEKVGAGNILVTPLEVGEVRSIRALRERLEVQIAERAAPFYTDGDILWMRSRLERWHGSRSPELVVSIHNELHQAVVGPAASALELQVVELLWRATERYIRATLPTVPMVSLTPLAAAYERLVNAAQSRSGRRVARDLTRLLKVLEHVIGSALPRPEM